MAEITKGITTVEGDTQMGRPPSNSLFDKVSNEVSRGSMGRGKLQNQSPSRQQCVGREGDMTVISPSRFSPLLGIEDDAGEDTKEVEEEIEESEFVQDKGDGCGASTVDKKFKGR